MATRDTVLSILKASDAAVSGEFLAGSCNVSRAAIWKAVNSLRSQGYTIEGTTNGGYILSGTPDTVSVQSVSEYLFSSYPLLASSHIETYDSLDSTNNHAKRLLVEAGSLRSADGSLTLAGEKYNCSVYVAEHQSAGRGRLGRTFVSPQGTGIYLSVIYAPAGGITEPAKLTAFSAVAVKRVIERLYGVQASIKWINDVYVNGRKVCGILTEGVTNFETGLIESAIVGIGINISDNSEVFEKAGSVAGSITGSADSASDGARASVSRALLAASVAGETLSIFSEESSSVMDEYRKASFTVGRKVQVRRIIGDESSYYDAEAVAIADDASLVVRIPDGSTRALNSGEVTLHRDN